MLHLFTSRNKPDRQTHRVSGNSQALLDESLERGLQDQVLVWDGLLRDLFSRDGLHRLKWSTKSYLSRNLTAASV